MGQADGLWKGQAPTFDQFEHIKVRLHGCCSIEGVPRWLGTTIRFSFGVQGCSDHETSKIKQGGKVKGAL